MGSRRFRKNTVVLFVCVGGCSMNGGVDAPVAEVVSAKITQQTADGVRVEVTVLLSQNNKVPLPLTMSEADFTIGNTATRSITDKPHRTIPVGGGQGTGKQVVVIPIAYPISAGIVPGSEYNVTGSITYEPPGEFRRILTESGFPLPTADFSRVGRLE